MKRSAKVLLAAFVATMVCSVGLGRAAEVSQAEYEKLRKEVEALRQKLATSAPVASSSAVDQVLENKYGPNAGVTTQQGKLTMGGLLQVWYYTIQNDNRGWVDADQASGVGSGYGSNEVNDNDSFRIRRAELKFTMDIHENVTAVVMIDPAQEASSFPTLSNNQGVYMDSGSTSGGNVRNSAMRTGSGSANRLLQNAYINYHGILPHHDVTVGQFMPHIGEEGVRSSSTLDFVERAMITRLTSNRDLGMEVHGTWWDDRLQYYVGVFNGAGTAFQERRNRSDDNDDKDLVGSILVRPLWKDELWGSIELGYGIRYGNGGESGSRFTGRAGLDVDGLNRHKTVHMNQSAWAMYAPGGPVRGLWLRGEWGMYRDRFAPADVRSVADDVITDPAPFNIQGWYMATGYKMCESRWADDLSCGGLLSKSLLLPMEFVFRYDVMENLFYQDLVDVAREVDVYRTQVYTAGINYYIKGHNAKLQFNYNWVIEEDDNDNPNSNFATANGRQTREVSNNNFIVNFQVAW